MEFSFIILSPLGTAEFYFKLPVIFLTLNYILFLTESEFSAVWYN